jgi:hypothetical protein
MGIKEENVRFRYSDGLTVVEKTDNLNYGQEMRCGVYLGAGADIGHIRISALWKKANSGNDRLNEKNCGILTVAYLFE